MLHHDDRCSEDPLASWEGPDADVVEVPLLLPSWQVQALERAAHQLGLTAAEMVRGVLGSFIKQFPVQETFAVLSRQTEEALKD